MKKKKYGPVLGLIPFILILVGFLVAPLIAMFMMSIKNSEGLMSFAMYQEIFTSEYYRKSISNSLSISFVSSVIGLIISMVAAYSITQLSSKWQDRMLSLSNLTSNFSGVPLAFAFMIMLGSSGLFVQLAKTMNLPFLSGYNVYSWSGLTMMYIYFQIPLGTMLLYPAFHGVKEEWKQASALLGASSLKFWMYIGLPVILPSIAGVFSILFANAMGAYASAFALVQSNFNILPIEIGALIQGDVFSRTDLASALAIVLAIILILTLMFSEFMMRRVRRDM